MKIFLPEQATSLTGGVSGTGWLCDLWITSEEVSTLTVTSPFEGIGVSPMLKAYKDSN